MSAPVDTGMEAQAMRTELARAKKGPVNCAVGVGSDPKLGLMLLDKTKQPKALEALVKKLPGAKNVRYGTAFVDADDDPKLLKLRLNQATSGMARRLVKTLKGTGFSKVRILLEDGSLVEEAGAEEEEQEEAGGRQETAQPAAAGEAAQQEPAQATAPDRAALMADLTALVHAIPGVAAADPSRKDALGKLAAAAGAAIKADLAAAPPAIGALRKALAGKPNGHGAPAADHAPAGDDRAKVASALRELMTRIPAAIAANPEAKTGLTTLAGAANTQLKAGNLEAAAATVEKLHAALEPGAPDGRLDDLAAQASLLPEPGRTALLEQVKQVRAKPDAKALDALERAVADAAKAARAAQAQQEAGNTVAYRLLQRKWIEAEAEAQKDLGRFLDALLGDQELQADERFAQLQAEANSFAALIPDDGGKLLAALGQLDDAGDAERPKALRAAAAALDTYRHDLDATGELETLQDVADQFYGGPKFFTALQASLTGLAGELSKRG